MPENLDRQVHHNFNSCCGEMANAAETLASFIVWPHRMYKSLQVSIPASNYHFG